MDHDHSHGSDGGSGESAVSCPMIMVFHGGHCERILWKGWVASTVTEFVFSCLAFFLIAFVYEALKFGRVHLQRRSARKESERSALQMRTKMSSPACSGCSNNQLGELSDNKYIQRIANWPHLVQTMLNIVQVVIAYLLMLVFMTFNYWLCLAVILGLGFGYFCFGWIKGDAYDNECCQ